jgi:hypothetical protein
MKPADGSRRLDVPEARSAATVPAGVTPSPSREYAGRASLPGATRALARGERASNDLRRSASRRSGDKSRRGPPPTVTHGVRRRSSRSRVTAIAHKCEASGGARPSQRRMWAGGARRDSPATPSVRSRDSRTLLHNRQHRRIVGMQPRRGAENGTSRPHRGRPSAISSESGREDEAIDRARVLAARAV